MTHETIKVLTECINAEACINCEVTDCYDIQDVLERAIDCIKCQQAEIEKLKNSRDRWKQLAKDFDEDSRENEKELESLYAENETLNNRLSKLQWSCDFELDYRKELLKRAKAEAIEMFAERLKKELGFGRYTSYKDIDNLVEEMVGANNDR